MRNRIWLLGLITVLEIVLGGAALLLTDRPALAEPVGDNYSVYYVAPGGDCGGMVPCYASVQAAVDAVDGPGETVKVAEGTFTSILSSVVQITRSLTLQGGYALGNWDTPYPWIYVTTLDGQDERRALLAGGPITTTIAGFHITRGRDAGNDYPDTGGAGVRLEASGAGRITLQDNYIFDNHSVGDTDAGGGVFVGGEGSGVTLARNRIENNTAVWVGGGVFVSNSSPTLIENTIISNTALGVPLVGCGGGIGFNAGASGGTLTLVGNDIAHNYAAGHGCGGGAVFVETGHLVSIGNRITHNSTDGGGPGGIGMSGGGAIYLIFSGGSSTNDWIAYNYAEGRGGAVFLRDRAPSTFVITHTTLLANQSGDGAAISFPDPENRRNNSVSVINSIIASHTVGITATTYNTVTVNGILWHAVPITVAQQPSATIDVQNQYYGDPLLAADGYHIGAGSAALNRGVPTEVATDIDGEPRPSGPAPDLGADEFQEQLELPGLPQQMLPPSGTVIPVADVIFSWEAGSGGAPEGYNLDLDGAVVTTTSTSYASRLSAGPHTWRVRAFNAAGYSAWTGLWTVEVRYYSVYLPLTVKSP